MAIKLDMERAYDRMRWDYLRRTLQDFGFQERWITWVMDCVESPSFAILVNGVPTDFFSSSTGLRQGCPLSPYLFILCADGLSRALRGAAQRALMEPYLPAPGAQSLSHLLFADDCLLLGRASRQTARTLVQTVDSYCRESGQLVNLQKSTVIFSPKTKPTLKADILSILAIPEQTGPLMYLGVPMTGGRLLRRDCIPLVQRICDRLEGWQASSLSMMGRITLIRSVLSSIPIYFLANTLIPRSCLCEIEQLFRNFLWRHRHDSHSIHLVAWDAVCRPIREGGLGIFSLPARREALIARHAARFLLQPSCLWSTVMRARYGPWMQSSPVVPPHGCSIFWREICSRAPLVLGHIRWLVGDGTSIDAIHDSWISSTPISRWPTFVSIEAGDNLRVRDLISEDGRTWRVQEIHSLFGSQLAARIVAIPVPTAQCCDVRVWGHSCLPRAPTGSLYDLCREHPGAEFVAAWVWKLPVHPRVQLFIWKVARNRLPTRSLLRRRGMDLEETCPVCGVQEESTEHAILSCSRATLTWRFAGSYPWAEDADLGVQSFLQFLQQSRSLESSQTAYIAYQIWLARNATTFEAIDTPVHRIVQRAILMTREYCEAHTVTSLDNPGPWDSHAASAAALRAIPVCWEPPLRGLSR